MCILVYVAYKRTLTEEKLRSSKYLTRQILKEAAGELSVCARRLFPLILKTVLYHAILFDQMQPTVDKLTGSLGRCNRLKMVLLVHQKHTAAGREESEVKNDFCR